MGWLICFIYQLNDGKQHTEGVWNFLAAFLAAIPLDRWEGNDSLVLPFNCIPILRPTSPERTRRIRSITEAFNYSAEEVV